MPKSAAVTSDIKILRSIQLIGGLIAAELILLNVLYAVYLIESSSMSEMLYLSRSMNASTSVTMARAYELMAGIEPGDVAAIAKNARLITTDINTLLGPIAQHSNVSALVEGVQRVAGAVDATAIASAVADAATVMRSVDAGVSELHPAILARRVVELIQIIDPVKVRAVLGDILNVTAETRAIVDSLAASHNVQLTF